MRVEDLFEGVSKTLYHFTTFDHASGILRSNTMRSRIGEISFSRSVMGSYPRDHRMIGVLFELDGEALGHRYSGSPVGREEMDEDDWQIVHLRGKGSQMEDRIYTNEIKGIRRYITRAIIYMPREVYRSGGGDNLDGDYNEQLRHIIDVVKELKGIPFITVTSERGMPTANFLLRNAPRTYNDSVREFKSMLTNMGFKFG